MAITRRSNRVARILYKSILTKLRRETVVPALVLIPEVRVRDLIGLEDTEHLPSYELGTFEGASLMLRWAFDRNGAFPVDSNLAEDALDRGFEALRLLNILASVQRRRSLQEDRNGVQYSVGHVVRHRKLGYRGVIYGWDPNFIVPKNTFQKSLSDVPSGPRGAMQPGYYVLPDEGGGSRHVSSKYVPQDSIEILVGGRVANHNISKYFTRYSRQLRRYIPVTHLRYLYPDVYLSEDEEDDEDEDDDPFSVNGSKVMLIKCKESGQEGGQEGSQKEDNFENLPPDTQPQTRQTILEKLTKYLFPDSKPSL